MLTFHCSSDCMLISVITETLLMLRDVSLRNLGKTVKCGPLSGSGWVPCIGPTAAVTVMQYLRHEVLKKLVLCVAVGQWVSEEFSVPNK